MVFGTWDLNFGAWEILGYGFQDMVFKTWDLNFGSWIFTLVVSKTETQKLLGCDFQDVGSQFWDLDFTHGPHSGLQPWAPTSSNKKPFMLPTLKSGKAVGNCCLRAPTLKLGKAVGN
jgi:hypothetical protein